MVQQEQQAQVKLDLYITASDDSSITWEYAAEVFDETTVSRLAGSYVAALAAAMRTPQGVADRVNLVGADGWGQLANFSIGILRQDYFRAPLAHEAFTAFAAAHPSAGCLTMGGETLTYGEVEARANRLAWRLVQLGIKPNVAVGIMIDRSFDLMIAILAVLKSGGGCWWPCLWWRQGTRLPAHLTVFSLQAATWLATLATLMTGWRCVAIAKHLGLPPGCSGSLFPCSLGSHGHTPWLLLQLQIYLEDGGASVLCLQQHHADRANALGGATATWQASEAWQH